MSSLSTGTLIIGANRGIGLGLVKQAFKAQPNATIYATARNLEAANDLQELKKQHGDRLILLEVDIVDEASIEKAVATLKSHTSTLELLIVNSGQALGFGPITDLTPKDFLDNLNVNVVGPHNLVKHFSPFLVESKHEKKIIALMSSLAGSINEIANATKILKDVSKLDYNPLAGYSSTKAALNMIGRQWGQVLEPQGVLVSLIHPGVVATDMNPGDGISVEESSIGIFNVLLKLREGNADTTSKGILSYDGVTWSW